MEGRYVPCAIIEYVVIAVSSEICPIVRKGCAYIYIYIYICMGVSAGFRYA